jgi:hypothetical protein
MYGYAKELELEKAVALRYRIKELQGKRLTVINRGFLRGLTSRCLANGLRVLADILGPQIRPGTGGGGVCGIDPYGTGTNLVKDRFFSGWISGSPAVHGRVDIAVT